jgi:hypothetical protein
MYPIPSNSTQTDFIEDLFRELSQVDVVPIDHGLSCDVKVGELRRGRGFRDDQMVGFATLVEKDGVLFWKEGISTRSFPQRRGFGHRGFAVDANRVATVKFEKLGANEVASKLEILDAKFTPTPGLRELRSGNLISDTISVIPVSTGRILLFIHGTFSNSDRLLDELRQEENVEGQKLLAAITAEANGKRTNYDQVLTFDHYTISRSPVLNALELARLFQKSDADVDIICHSRGGLVTRWFFEVFDHGRRRRRRAVMVGSPLGGTSLAAPDRIRYGIDLFTNVGKVVGTGLSLVPFTQVAGGLLRVVFSIGNIASRVPLVDAAVAMIPGLGAMSRVSNNFELLALKDRSVTPPDYFAITSRFRGDELGWPFWKVFCDFKLRAAEAADRLIFRDSSSQSFYNDLVVDTVSMTQYGFPDNPEICEFGEKDHVYHTIYFSQERTIKFIRERLSIS